MAEADLDVVIRSIAKKQVKALTDAARKRQGRLMTMAGKAKDKASKDRYRQLAKSTRELASAAARRLEITAENTAESYARAIKKAAEDIAAAQQKEKPAAKAAKPKAAKPKAAKAAKPVEPAKAEPAVKPARKKSA